MATAFRLRRERDPGRIMAFLELSSSTMTLMYVSLLLLLTGGIVAGFMGQWWEQGWIWVSLGTLVAIILAMFALATTYYRRLRRIVGAMAGGAQAVSSDRLGELLAGPRPWILAVVGFGGILFILYLMMFKPF